MRKPIARVTSSAVTQYESLRPLLENMLVTFQELAKKKPEAALSKAKVIVVNRLLMPIHSLVESEPDKQFLDLLDEATLPQNSDVVLILGQTLTVMQNYKLTHSHRNENGYGWSTADRPDYAWETEDDEPAESPED